MKIEKLSKRKYIKTSIIVLVLISIFGVIFINKSKAKYRVTQSIQVVSGEVNYTNLDFSMLGVKLQSAKGSSDYVSASNNEVPESGYKLKPLGDGTTDSYCTINGTKNNTGITIIYENGSVTFKGIKKQGTRCYLFFDLKTEISGSDLLGEYTVNSTSEGCPNYEDAPSVTSTETKALFCKGKDDFGDTYYFRGNPTNNWVKIGNFYWRIIRFNGNGSIRLIYSGNGSPTTSGTDTQTKILAYNNSYDNVKYVKYMDDNMSNSTLKNPKNSTIKQELDDWYETNLKSTYGGIMDGAVGFCNDADTGSSTNLFKPYDRIEKNKKPTFKCGTPKTNLFTTEDGTYGNQKLTYPVGLITADEASFAGGTYSDANSGYYLYTGQNYWTMSPSNFYDGYGSRASVFVVYYTGKFSDYAVGGVAPSIRPVINLKADTQFKEGGNGTSTNPYEVVI